MNARIGAAVPFTTDDSATSTAPPDLIFRHLAMAEAWTVWGRLPGPMRAVRERPGDELANGIGAVRRISRVREQVVEYEPPHHYAYVALAGLPIDDYRADVTIQEGNGGTTIRWRARFEQRIPGTGPLLRLFTTLLLRTMTRRLAKHAERCKPGCPAH
jgi:hypothetical protein